MADAVKAGVWLGGPEPVSGKLRSGITTWYRLDPPQPARDEPFDLILRFEDVDAAGATVAVSTSDGARFAPPAGVTSWALPLAQASQLKLRLLAPAGSSYVHVQSQQRGRSSVRSVLLSVPAADPAAAPVPRKDYAIDAQGEPIVRKRADKSP